MKAMFRNFISVFFLSAAMSMSASSSGYTVMLSKNFLPETPDVPKETPRRQRVPSLPIECVISLDGMNICDTSINATECLSFEIWDSFGSVCVMSFSEESSFVDAFVSISGEYQVRLVFTDYELVGNVEI